MLKLMTYIPKVKKLTEEIIITLQEDKFFEDFDITDLTYARKRISEELTKKFLVNGLDDEFAIFTEDELDKILREIAAEDVLRILQNRGLVNSYEDENTEEIFFLTDAGKEELKKPDGEQILNIFTDNKKID